MPGFIMLSYFRLLYVLKMLFFLNFMKNKTAFQPVTQTNYFLQQSDALQTRFFFCIRRLSIAQTWTRVRRFISLFYKWTVKQCNICDLSQEKKLRHNLLSRTSDAGQVLCNKAGLRKITQEWRFECCEADITWELFEISKIQQHR